MNPGTGMNGGEARMEWNGVEQRLYCGLEGPIFTDCCFLTISNLPSALSTWLEHVCACVYMNP